eukprot:74691_1
MSFIQQTFNLFKSFYPNVISQNSQVWSTHSCSLIKTVLMLTLVVSHAVSAPTSTPTTSESICDFKFYSYPDHEFAEQSGYTLMTYNRLQDSNPFPYKAHFINFLQANNGNIQALAQFSTSYSSITYGAKIGFQGYDCMGVTNYDWTYFHTDVPTGGVYWVDINYSIYFGSSRAKKTSWSTSDVFTKQGLVSC